MRIIGAGRDGALHALSGWFYRRAGARRICLNEGPCVVEGGVFRVRQREVWDGPEFPAHCLSEFGREMLKQLQGSGGATRDASPPTEEMEEDDAKPVERLCAEEVVATGSTKRKRERVSVGCLSAPASARLAAVRLPVVMNGHAEPGSLRGRLVRLQQRQQCLGPGRRAEIGGDPPEPGEVFDADPAQDQLRTGAKIGTMRTLAGARRAGVDAESRGQKEDIMRSLRRTPLKKGFITTLASSVAVAEPQRQRNVMKKEKHAAKKALRRF